MTDEMAHKMHTKNPPKMGSGGFSAHILFTRKEI